MWRLRTRPSRPGETLTWPGEHPGEIVCFTDGSLDIAGKATKVERGETAFETAKARRVKNTGSSDVHYARIEFLGKGSAETWGKTGLAPNYKLLFENRYTRVLLRRPYRGRREGAAAHASRPRGGVPFRGASLST